ncbi:hypothetical protein F5890DRAFT_1514723 [Lentinula detonsa]|uniref:Uncharacterized protein n=1 Tax=Lentinula detonsa TaxID=2804962 RepID=A0AA38Q0L0_9AGAR|nr:hypothetical protein F5890DRAFT_1514723 [Lentinula detonsa]
MITGAEISIALSVVSKLISTLSTSALKNGANEIVGDQKLVDLLGELYRLNEEQATTLHDQRDLVCKKIERLGTCRGPKYIVTRYSIARSAYSSAKVYKTNLKIDTASAKLQAFKESELRKQKGEPDMKEARSRDQPTEETHFSILAQNIENSTPRHIVRSSSTIVFDYSLPVGTPENPAIHCPVGSEPTIPKGLKPGNIIFYNSSQASSHHSHATSHHSDTSMSEHRSVDNASELIAEADHLAEILVSINNSNASIATTFYNLDINNETDADGSDCGSSGDLTGGC